MTLIKTPAPPAEKPTSGGPGHKAPSAQDSIPIHVQPEAEPEPQEARGATPSGRGPGSVLSALARAVTGEAPVVPGEAPVEAGAGSNGVSARPSGLHASITPLRPEEGGRRVRASRPRQARLAGAVPSRVPGSSPSNPILLDRPLRGSPAPGTTLPGLGTPAEELLAPVARLRAAETRDEVIAILLDYASLLAARVGLFVIQKGQLTCLDGRGPDHVVVAMKWFTIPVDEPSPFRDVLQSRAPYIGSLGDSPESRSFRSALGTTSGDLLLLPLIVGDRSVGVLYADEIRADLAKLSVELEVLSREAGAAFSRIILSRKSGQRR